LSEWRFARCDARRAAILRNPELEAIFDGPLDAGGITEAAVQRVVADQKPESEVLDVKQVLWAKSPRPRPPRMLTDAQREDGGDTLVRHG